MVFMGYCLFFRINRPEEMQMLLGRVDRRIEALQKMTQDAKVRKRHHSLP